MSKPESHHETDSAVGPIGDEARWVAVPISQGGTNGAIPEFDGRGDDLRGEANMMTISVIVGSTRQGRFGEKPAQWILEHLRNRKEIEA